ncbi:glycosyl transferase [Skermanella stibiiresistens SB22]|uniref:Glycosyl transferase n=1 Tax=Skermanella stibiiresistens SB22 TaxID=1385369 RepID=W9H613_9PROT|nr:glucoamylase family protein [Skermanella stibiiresistens]EWY41660.1 glycosyl transferase [Skermanella stibiiresistens SB22]
MKRLLRRALGLESVHSPWDDAAPVREELFSVERLEDHARSLAAAQLTAPSPVKVPPLASRVNDNAAVLLSAYRSSAAALEAGHGVVPAAEWLLDNYHLVEEQIREIREDLPPGYYRQLPKLASGPFTGYPRVFGIAWAFVAHTDSHFDPEMLRRFVRAYQTVQPLTIGELWAVAITLRIVLVENLRRLAVQITDAHQIRAEADKLADRMLGTNDPATPPTAAPVKSFDGSPLPELLAAQLAKRLRGQDPRVTPAQGWLEERLGSQGTSIEEVVRGAQQRQGASNVTVRNIITSIRLISDTDWADLFEAISLVDDRLRSDPAFAEMDFPTRNLYRSAIEELARGSGLTEIDVTTRVLEAARNASGATGEDGRARDPGYHLIAGGRRAFENAIGFRPPFRRRLGRLSVDMGIRGYVGAIAAVTALLLLSFAWLAWDAAAGDWPGGWSMGWHLALLALIGLFPVMDAATALVNRAVARIFGATALPALELAHGIPPNLRTLVAVPTLLTGAEDLAEQIERLEVHHLASPGGELRYALLTDWLDADEEKVAGDDELLGAAAEAIARLNAAYGSPGGSTGEDDRFFLLHRRRVFNEGENRWMGWERKRGKLHELNRLLRGASDTGFIGPNGGAPAAPAGIRYVVTLDADTRLPRDTVRRLIGKMAHPLNQPRFDARTGRVVDGYAILQPRVTPALPVGREGSLYQRAYSGPGGMDPYAAAVSDVYQDLFGEGSYTGKGIYDIDAFEAALAGRVPDNTLLSHDLFEGTFARAALASDIEVVEDSPARYDVAAKRQHRWARGDWQLLPWIAAGLEKVGKRPGRRGIPAVGLWKMLDNLRRTLLAPATLVSLVAGWLLLPLDLALGWTAFILVTIAVPIFLPVLFAIVPRRSGITPRSHFGALRDDLSMAGTRFFLQVAFLADQAWLMGDAVARTLVRLFVTRRHLLEWVTAAQARVSPRLDLAGFYGQMAGGVVLGVAAGLAVVAFAPAAWPVALPFVALWLAAPAVALWTSRSPTAASQLGASEDEARTLRLIARRTWRFFETFVTPAENNLPPDNFQEDPRPVVAHRTSPTNIGLYLLSTVAARDFGWAGRLETIERLEATLTTMGKLRRFRGHLFNWYETRDLRVLEPAYVSSVDSGNLAGHLIALANTCKEWALAPADGVASWATARAGMIDDHDLAREALARLVAGAKDAAAEDARQIEAALDGVRDLLSQVPTGTAPGDGYLGTLKALTGRAADLAETAAGAAETDDAADLAFWTSALDRVAAAHQRDALEQMADPDGARQRLAALETTARGMAVAMDFAFLLDPERKLLSIGYSVPDNALDRNCYDLLASEARLASLFAIAKGDVPARHWFRLGRTATPLGHGAALISWSGSMFEYLMPSLVMRAPAGSLLERTNQLVVERQQAYGHALGIPWGISESAYNARDLEFTYQYSNFGVPGLGLKRGLSENAVIAPYATGLATMVDPKGAVANFARLADLGASGRYGFHEALDFTRTRLPEGKQVAIVRNFMAHHQGMTITAIANTLQAGRMRARFHAEPMIQAVELLLQERTPRDVAVAHPRAEEVRIAATDPGSASPQVRRLKLHAGTSPATLMLSNGRYAVMLTSAGSGFSRWRDLAVTRWREDATRDDWGSYVFLRDARSGAVWSAGYQPTGAEPDSHDITFSEDRAEYIRHDGTLVTTLEIVVSAEDNAEVRRVSVANGGRQTREIDLTSYAEIVLAATASDSAHPAFSKMFVQTEYLPEYGAIVATRRRRSPSEPEVWAAHLAVVEGVTTGDAQIETDRARFIGRGHALGQAVAIHGGGPLSNTVGTVLDPIFALRRRVVVAPSKTARVAFWTMLAASRAELLDLIDKHQDRNAFERATTLAWTQAQVQLRHLGVKPEEAADFQNLAGHIIHADPRLRPPSETIRRGAGPQSGLWPHGISGDIPIVLVHIDDVEDMEAVRQLLRAHEYWRMKQLPVDLVILNERTSSYVQDLQIAIETAVRTSQSRARFGEEPARGTVFVLRKDLITAEGRALLHSVARVVLNARGGGIAQQLGRLEEIPRERPDSRAKAVTASVSIYRPAPREGLAEGLGDGLEFFNGLGGFADDGRQYVTVLRAGQSTPAPWINVIANPGFGFHVATEGGGYTWAGNSRENQLTPWSNDPVTDAPGEAVYLRDEDSGALFGPTALPIRDGGTYVARHGHGHSRFEHAADGLALDLLQYVPLDDPIKISRLTVRNLSNRPRHLSVTSYVEWVLGTSRGASAPFIVTSADAATGALFAGNPWNAPLGGRVAFADMAGRQTAWTADRREFIGRNGTLASPEALRGGAPLSGATGAGLDPCAVLQTSFELAPGASIEIVMFLGETGSAEAASALIERYRAIDLDHVLAEVEAHWRDLLGTIQVKTPDRALDIMLNGWLQYQTLACRIWARSAFYQASGAYGFRDQLQDGMALTFARPEMTRHHLLRAAGRQFVEGDVQHWWLPATGQGVRTRISDDRVWLAFGVASYIEVTEDRSILDEMVPFLEGQHLKLGEHDAFFQPTVSDEAATLFEHCARGLDQCVALTGEHGLPLMGTGDWNDGMNRVGEAGKGESVWLGWLLLRTVDLFAPMAEDRDPGRAAAWREHAASVRVSLEREAWDGAWYRRGIFDDGTPFGRAGDAECRIDSIAQSWAVLSEAANPDRAARAMASVDEHLILRDEKLALLFTPPFDKTPLDPGYIKAYPPGLRENGGQYSHAAMWAIMAFAKLGQGDRAGALLSLLNPINHASDPAGTARYKVEPYVVAADVYSVAPHAGRGGWTWYTGSAGWMYRAGIEAVLGIRQRGALLLIDPCIPADWPGFQVAVRRGATRYDISVENPAGCCRGIGLTELDGAVVDPSDGPLAVPLDGGVHTLRIVLEKAALAVA